MSEKFSIETNNMIHVQKLMRKSRCFISKIIPIRLKILNNKPINPVNYSQRSVEGGGRLSACAVNDNV